MTALLASPQPVHEPWGRTVYDRYPELPRAVHSGTPMYLHSLAVHPYELVRARSPDDSGSVQSLQSVNDHDLAGSSSRSSTSTSVWTTPSPPHRPVTLQNCFGQPAPRMQRQRPKRPLSPKSRSLDDVWAVSSNAVRRCGQGGARGRRPSHAGRGLPTFLDEMQNKRRERISHKRQMIEELMQGQASGSHAHAQATGRSSSSEFSPDMMGHLDQQVLPASLEEFHQLSRSRRRNKHARHRSLSDVLDLVMC